MSKQISVPPSPRPRANQSADMPVNVPTSTTVSAPGDRHEHRHEATLVGADVHAGEIAEALPGRGRQLLGDGIARRVGVGLDVGAELL